MKKVFFACMLTMFCFFTAPCLVHAQDDGFPGDPGEPDVPFDSGVSLLLIAGVAYGAVKMYESRHRKDENKTIKKTAYRQEVVRRKMNRIVSCNKLSSGISVTV